MLHYELGNGHQTYSKLNNGAGREFGLNPWENVKIGYIQQKIVNYSNPSNLLYDYSSRTGTAGTEGEVLQVPIDGNGNQFFLIANRRKVSDWDRRMAGDTVAGYYLKDINPEYGRGIYIYHVNDGYNEPPSGQDHDIDMECADGLWDWTQDGIASPIWDSDEFHPVFAKTTVKYNQDNPAVHDDIGKDGMSLVKIGYANGDTIQMWGNWYSQGKSHTYSPLNYGTDRVYSNDNNYWYSLEAKGDRWDAWNIGYNEVFSPYSSPNTKSWSNDNTGIFIWYQSFNSSTKEASIKVYRAGEGGMTDSSILQITPPSRPMGLEISESYPPNSSYCHPKLTWNHNLEPDMVRSNGFLKYKIYRAVRSNMSSVPYSYDYLATVDKQLTSPAVYIDNSVTLYDCSFYDHPPSGTPYPVRYYIKAVDKYDFESVPSNFVQEVGVAGEIEEADNMTINSNLPKEYSLKQNFPNPFNPSTNIHYDLPNDNFVTIKIYDLLGKEVLTLVNEAKTPGSYIISFNASNLSSGIYYYKIKAGSFEQVRKMILLK